MNEVSKYALGVDNPIYYVVGHQITEDELDLGAIYNMQTDSSSKYMLSIAKSVGITTSNSRFVKMITDVGDDIDEEEYIQYLKDDIRKSKPKLIIVLGGGVARHLAPGYSGVTTTRGKLLNYEDEDFETKLLVTYSPNYVVGVIHEIKNSKKIEAADEFYKDFNYARQYVDGELVDIDSKEMTYALTYDQFKEYYDKYLVNADTPAFDIESNAKEPTSSQFRVIGFSLSPDSTRGIYVVRDALEYKMPESDWEKIVDLVVDYMKRTTIVVHNCGYEIPAIINEWKYHIKDFEDTLAMAKVLQGGKIGAGLVAQCTKELGYPVWDADLDNYISSIRAIKDNLFPTPSGNNRWDYDLLINECDKDLYKLYQYYNSELEGSKKAEERIAQLENSSLAFEDTVEMLLMEYADSLSDLSDYNYSDALNYVKESGEKLEYQKYSRFNELFTEVTTNISQDINSVRTRARESREKLDKITSEISELKESVKSLTRREEKVYEGLEKLVKTIKKHYEGDQFYEIMKAVSGEVIRMVEIRHTGLPSYSTIPLKIITDYGAMDAIGTRELYEHLGSRLTNESSNQVNLWSGYRVAKANLLAGVAMEMNGLHWNDEVAKEEHKWYADQCYISASNMIKSGYLDDYIFENCQYILHDDVMENRMHEVKEILGDFQMMKTSIRLIDENGNRIRTIYHKRILEELEKAQPGYIESNREWLLNTVKSNLGNREVYKDYNDLKDIFNPNSTLVVPTLSKIFVTEDIKVGYIITQLNLLIDDDQFDIENYGSEDRKLFDLIQRFRQHDKEVELYNDSKEAEITGPREKIPGRIRFEKFKRLLGSIQIQSKEIANIIAEGMEYYLDSASEPNIIDLFHHFENTGIDIEDESTWTKEFQFFYNYRVWKKCNKMITSYITGNKVGRGSVYVVDKNEALSKKELPIRKRLYNSEKPKSDDEIYLMTSPPSVMAADTMRWTWALHTIPAGSSIKNIYTSRYQNGMTASPDYCLTGDTMIKLADGSDVRIDELVGVDEFSVYAYDKDTDSMTVGRGHGARLVRYADKLIKLTTNTGGTVECTPEHQFLLTTGEYVEAQDLVVGSEIMFGEISEEDSHIKRSSNGDYYISKIEWIDVDRVPTYCFTVDKYHNFLLSNGVISKNSQLEVRMIAGAAKCKPMLDAFANGADIHLETACFTGDTKVLLEDGRSLSFEELVQEYPDPDERFRVYSVDDENNIVIGEAYHPRFTKHSELVEVEIVGGESVKCTPDHLWRTDKGYTQAQDLVEGDLLISIQDGTRYENYEVKCVRELDETADVYDLTVDKYHNFAIDISTSDTKSGVFVHNSKVWRKPPEEITDAERRYSKMTTFAILYGATPKNIANNFMGGDVAAATDMYDSFFEGYPELRVWVDERHKEMMETGKVSCSNLGYYLNINPEDFYDGEEGAKRASQNYPIQSFRGSTAITGVDGSVVTFKELVDRGSDNFWVWTYDHDTNSIIPMKGVAPQVTGESDVFYKITLDNGKYFEVTPEHLCMIRDGSYVRADELEVGQSLMPLYTAGETYQKIATDGVSNSGNYMHKLVYDMYGIQPIDTKETYAIHHIDLDPTNNHPTNLCKLPSDYHLKYHALIRREHGQDMIDELEMELSTILRKVYKTSDAEILLSRFSKFHRSDNFNLVYVNQANSISYRNKIRSNQYEEWDKNQRQAVSKEVMRRYEETGSVLGINDPLKRSELHKKVWEDHGDKIRESLKKGHNTEDAIENHRQSSIVRERCPEYVFNRVVSQLCRYYENNINWRTPEDWDAARYEIDLSLHSSRKSSYILKYYTWDEFLSKADEYLSTYNHKIVAIEVIRLAEPEPKYDLEVPKYHNFALDAGVFVHNSQGSMTGGFVANEINEYIKSNNLLSKLVLFTHDSIGIDIHPDELFKIGTTIIPLMNELPLKEFGIPTKADITVGASIGQEMDVTHIQADDDKMSGIIRFSGFEDDYLAAKRCWEDAYRIVEDRDYDESSEIYIPRGDLFVPKKAIHKTFGTSRRLVNKEVKIII